MELIQVFFDDDEIFPNSRLPVLIYRAFLGGEDALNAAAWEQLLERNGWGGGWRNGLFSYHHYHSTAHEVLCVYRGWADARLGGEGGKIFRLEAGDAVILPAGTAHKNEGQGGGFAVAGSYPEGTYPDMNYGRDNERPAADSQIASLAVPPADPLLADGGLTGLWN